MDEKEQLEKFARELLGFSVQTVGDKTIMTKGTTRGIITWNYEEI